jgi:hypothetical protein
MSGLLDRAAAFFLVAAAPPSPAVATASLPTAARAVVLGGRTDAPSLAAAVALRLRAAEGAPAAVVALWQAVEQDIVPGAGADPPMGPGAATPCPADHPPMRRGVATPCPADHRPTRRGAATPSASRLAARLTARNLPAVARGRLVWLTLPSEPAAVATAVRRTAAVVDGPLVTALAGARPPVLDELVGEHDLAVVGAEPATPLARATLAALSDRGVRAVACRAPRCGLPRALALAGLATPRLEAPDTRGTLGVAAVVGEDR